MQRWFYIRDKQKIGPCSSVELRRLADAGQIQPGDMLLRDGEQRWVAARSVRGLFADAAAAAPPSAAVTGHGVWGRPAFWIVLLLLAPTLGCIWLFLEKKQLQTRLADQERQAAVIAASIVPPKADLADNTAVLSRQIKDQAVRLRELDGIISQQRERIAGLEERLRKPLTSVPVQLDKSPPTSPPAVKPPAAAGFEAIDKHALAAPAEAEKSIPALAHYLTDAATDDLLKVRAIYRWLTDRITYDLPALLANKFPDCSPEAVLAGRKTVCEGYAQLFEALSKDAGVPCAVIRGNAKTAFVVSAGNRIAHTWNAVKLQGKWKLLDATWSAGSVINGRYTKLFNDFYFLTPPDEFIFTHLPTEAKWQLLDRPVPADVFAAWPLVPPELLRSGVSVADVRKRLAEKDFAGFVKTFLHTSLVRIRKAPLASKLHKNERYTFAISCPQATQMAFFIGGRFSGSLARTGDVFEGAIAPAEGPVRVGVRTAESGGRFDFVLEYQVE